MNHQERQHIVNSTNDGNHINRPPEEIVEMVRCDTKGCTVEMEHHQHYVNGGLCFKCIMNIGK